MNYIAGILLFVSTLLGGFFITNRSENVGATIAYPAVGGTGSSTLTGILLGNGRSSVQSLVIGSNLTLTGSTLSASVTGGTGAPFPFTQQSYGVSTSTVVNFTAGLLAASSTFTGATTTFQGDISILGTSHLFGHGIQAISSEGIHFHSSNGSEVAYLGTGGETGATFNGGVNVTGALAANGGLSFTSGTGTSVVTLSSSTIQTLNTTSLTVPPLTSALLVTNGSGVVAEYAGSTCTDQAVTAISALGAATCTTLTSAYISGLDISDDTNLAATWPIVLTGDTLSWGGIGTSTTPTAGHIAYWNSSSLLSSVATGTISATSPLSVTSSRYAIGGSAAFSWDFSIANTWTGLQTFNTGGIISTASSTIQTLYSTDASFSGSLRLPNGTAPTVDAAGEIAVDTTSGQLKAYDGRSTNIYSATSTKSFTVSAYATDTASHMFALATSSWVTFLPEAVTVTGIGCMASSTGTALLRVTDSSNHVGEVICKPTTPGTNISLSNQAFTAFEPIYFEIGSTTSTDPSFVSPVLWYRRTAD